MDLLLLGYGKMNRLVAEMAAERGDRVLKTVAKGEAWPAGWSAGLVAIDFSAPDAVLDHVASATAAGIPLVIGTTGWLAQLGEVQALAEKAHSGVVYGANFSVGVQAFYRIVNAAAAALPPAYQAYIWEAHHQHKLDAPSGTALHLAALLRASGHDPGAIASNRAGAIPGTHIVGFDAADDSLTLTHTARSRRGFAAGALLAAQWILGRRGLHEFSEVMDSLAAGELS